MTARLDPTILSNVLVGIDIDFDEEDMGILGGERLEKWRDFLARTTPMTDKT